MGGIGGTLDGRALDTADETLAEVTVVEEHLHNNEKWFGRAATPVAETHVADRMSGTTLPFSLTSGNSAFGAWVQILGSDDTPVVVGMTLFDAHRILVTNTSFTNTHIVQIATGEASGLAAKIAAEDFTEFPYISETTNADSGANDILTERMPAGTKVWARTASVNSNSTVISLYYGIHEYEE